MTIPNLVGYLRLAAVPVFLYLAFSSDDGRTVTVAILFAAISAGDYVDGFLARVTGQYSRMGAVLDPVIDRITVLSGLAVCWHFELLPRWALAVLAVRELLTLGLAQIGMRRGLPLEINWAGRISVWLVMSAMFVALVMETPVADVLLLSGIAGAIAATVGYVRTGLSARGVWPT